MYALFIALFFAACLLPIAGLLWAGPSEPAANETPAAQPRLFRPDGAVNEKVFSELREYLGQSFYLRLEAITAWDTLTASVFRTSGNADVLLGPEGWLFYGASLGDITGADQMSDRAVWCAARSLYLMQEYAQDHGALFAFTVPCGKYTVYPEQAPAYIRVAEGSNRERLALAAESMGVCYADLYPAFEVRRGEGLYWHWDS